MNKLIVCVIFFLTSSWILISQTIKSDTIYGEKDFKYIEVVKPKGSYMKIIENGDTTIGFNDILYYRYQDDSMKIVMNNFISSLDYINRDTINYDALEYFYIKQFCEIRSSWSRYNLNQHVIYEKNLKGSTKGFICSLGNVKSNYINSCHSKSISKTDLIELIKILNEHMVLDSIPEMRLPDNMCAMPSMSSKDYYIEIILKEKNKKQIKKTLRPKNGMCFGLHERLKTVLDDYWYHKLDSDNGFNHFNLLTKKRNQFSQKEIIKEIESFVKINK